MITDSRPIWDASLAEILSQPATPGTRASATDIPGVNLEWMATDAYPTGAWFGDCGQPTLAQLYALPTAYLAFGARASVNGVQYTYGAAGWGAPPGAWVYVGATIPASGSYIGQLIQVDNNAVPSGRSILRWNGTLWTPPAGELIAGIFSDYYATPVASVVPGVITTTEIWTGNSIPEYMIPNSLVIRGSLQANIINASGVAGANIGLYVSSSPIVTNGFNGIVSANNLTPTTGGIGNIWQVMGVNYRWGSNIGGPDARGTAAGTLSESYAYTPGAGKLRLSVKPSSVTDRVNLYGAAIYSAGNL